MYIWERSDWPRFGWDAARLLGPPGEMRHKQGRLLGSMARLGFEVQAEAQIGALTAFDADQAGGVGPGEFAGPRRAQMMRGEAYASIHFQAVDVTLGGRPVLREIACDLPERRVALLGPNGSGKSTLARLVNGLVLPSAGRVLVDGLGVASDVKSVRRKVGYVFQNPANQIVFPIVEEDVAFGLRNLGLGREEATRKAREALAAHGIGDLAARPAETLSGGELQLVALIGVLVMEPQIVVLDEPTTMLDLRNRNRIAARIEGLAQKAILVTHDLDLAATCDRALVLDGGRIVADDEAHAACAWYRANLS